MTDLATTALDVRLLGPLEIRRGGQAITIGAPRQRVLLGALLVARGRPVSLSRLIDALWGGSEPRTARVTVQNYVRRLRTVLDAADVPVRESVIGTTPDGYVLHLDGQCLDLVRFHAHLARARVARDRGRLPDAEPAYRLALAEWRGEPLADLVTSGWLRTELDRLIDLQATATEEWAEVEISAGHAARGLEALADLTQRWPMRESARALMIRALHACGRSADALAEFRRARQVLRDELGIEPGEDLRRAHAEALGRPASQRLLRRVVPAQLPAGLTDFVARGPELAGLDALVRPSGSPTGAQVATICGAAGIGKSALAVHWAHRVAELFPDGQLYLDLRGFEAHARPMTVAEAVRGLLAALGVSEHRMAGQLSAQVGLYRSLLVGRRQLVVLDNAVDADQVRMLLPGAAGTVTLVTSRNELGSLVARDGARPLRLGLLDDADARRLLDRRLGSRRLAAEPAALATVVRRCGGLPLALAVVAARLLMEPRLSLGTVATQLGEAPGLTALSTGEPSGDVAAVFSWSVRALDPDAARLFCLLGLHPGPQVSAASAASLCAIPLADARSRLARLARASLLTLVGHDRYTMHDLLHAYAADLVRSDPAQEQLPATRRLVDHYLHSAHAAAGRLHSSRAVLDLPVPQAEVTICEPSDEVRARAWLDAERTTLLAAAGRAAEVEGLHGQCWQLARTVTGFLFDAVRTQEALHLNLLALSAAERAGDRLGLAHIHHGLAQVLAWAQEYARGREHLNRALLLFTELGDVRGQARCHGLLGFYHDRAEDHEAAVGSAQEALALHRAVDDPAGVAGVLNNLGWAWANLGDHERALSACLEALEIQRGLGVSGALSATLDSVGFVHQQAGRPDRAITYLTEAVAVAQRLGQSLLQVEALTHLGEALCELGDPSSAREQWTYALGILDDLDHPDAEDLRSRIHRLDSAPTSPARPLGGHGPGEMSTGSRADSTPA